MTLSVSLLLPLLSPILILLLATPIGVPILGYVALNQIRHSAGRLYGLGLALFDLWAFPLLAFHAVIAGLGIFAVRAAAGGLGRVVALSFIVVACVVADFLIVRSVWRAANQPPAGALPADHRQRAGLKTMLSVAALVLMFCLGVCSFAFLLWSVTERMESATARIRTRIFEADAKLVDELVPGPTRKPAHACGAWEINSRTPQTAEVSADVFAKLLADGANPPGLLDDQTREGAWWPKLATSSHYFRRGKVHGSGDVDGLLGIWRHKGVRQLRVEYGVLHGMNSEFIGATIVWEGSAPPPGAARAFFIPFSRGDGTARYLVIALEVGDGTENDGRISKLHAEKKKATIEKGDPQMFAVPLHASVIFWIAITLAPPDTSQILVKGPDETWAWTRQTSGWSFSADRSVWTVEGENVKVSFTKDGGGKGSIKDGVRTARSRGQGPRLEGVADAEVAAVLAGQRERNLCLHGRQRNQREKQYVIRFRRHPAVGKGSRAARLCRRDIERQTQLRRLRPRRRFRPAGGGEGYLSAIQIYASRYGYPQPPDEDFHVYVLDKDQKVLKEFLFPYSLIARGPERWYTLELPATEVPEQFHVALWFNAERTKGVYFSAWTRA